MSVCGTASQPIQPAYSALVRSGELARRVPVALDALACCALCPRGCRVDRVAGRRLGLCRTRRLAQVSSVSVASASLGLLAGTGQIVFAGGGLRSVFEGPLVPGREITPQALADQMLALQAAGCWGLNLVNAGHVVPQVLEALLLAAQRGLRRPLLLTTAAYDGPAGLRFLDGVVDIYRPAFHCWDPLLALRYLRARNYPLAARRAIRVMHRQTGDLCLDARGRPARGLWLRHPVLPGRLAGTRPVMRWLARQVSPATAVEIYAQPLPPPSAGQRFPEFAAEAGPADLAAARAQAQALGLRLLA